MLKVLLLRKHINNKKAALEALRNKDAEFQTREAELEAAINEVEDDEQRSAIEEVIAAFEGDKSQHDADKKALEDEIRGLEEELASEEAEQNTEVAEPQNNERKDVKPMNMTTRNKIFRSMNVQERDAFFAREDVQKFLSDTRSCIKEKRALSNVGLTIPTVMLGILRENLINYSKLYRHVDVRPINGEGRELIQGTVGEAIWTECCANLNELSLGFNDFEVDCFMVGGFYAVCNANIEDSDIDLAATLLDAIAQAIGIALDKAILFGRNAASTMKMPKGIVSRLVEESQPAGYSPTARPWVDLHTSNVLTIANTYHGKDLFAQILLDAGAAKGKYARGGKVWVMNETTYTFLMAEAVSIDANGAIVSGVNGTMPVVGGIIEVLDFIPDYVIIGGYFDLYLLAERAGQRFASSEHVRFLQNQTVFKGVARYDGGPVIAEAFVAIGVNGTTPSAAMTFASDEANGVKSIMVNTKTATIVGTGSIQLYAITSPGEGEVVWSSATTSKAVVDSASGVVTGVASGSSVITATCNGLTDSCTVTVTSA